MIFNFKIETKLGLRCYGGGMSQGSGSGKSSSSGSSLASSTSSSAPQYTPEQLMSLYTSALPQMLSTSANAASASPTAGSLDAANKGAIAGVNAINLNGLSPGEANAVERSSNQGFAGTGNLGNPNATNTITNALNFGGAFNSKLGLMNNAVNTATGVSNAGANILNTTTGAFQPFASNASSQVSQSNSLAGSQNQSSGKTSSSNNSFNVGGCYLTTACCMYKGLPDNCEELTVLRKFRDTYVPKFLVREYYELASTIEPKIHNNKEKLEYIYRVIKDCVSDIKKGFNESALNRYSNMVNELKNL